MSFATNNNGPGLVISGGPSLNPLNSLNLAGPVFQNHTLVGSRAQNKIKFFEAIGFVNLIVHTGVSYVGAYYFIGRFFYHKNFVDSQGLDDNISFILGALVSTLSGAAFLSNFGRYKWSYMGDYQSRVQSELGRANGSLQGLQGLKEQFLSHMDYLDHSSVSSGMGSDSDEDSEEESDEGSYGNLYEKLDEGSGFHGDDRDLVAKKKPASYSLLCVSGCGYSLHFCTRLFTAYVASVFWCKLILPSSNSAAHYGYGSMPVALLLAGPITYFELSCVNGSVWFSDANLRTLCGDFRSSLRQLSCWPHLTFLLVNMVTSSVVYYFICMAAILQLDQLGVSLPTSLLKYSCLGLSIPMTLSSVVNHLFSLVGREGYDLSNMSNKVFGPGFEVITYFKKPEGYKSSRFIPKCCNGLFAFDVLVQGMLVSSAVLDCLLDVLPDILSNGGQVAWVVLAGVFVPVIFLSCYDPNANKVERVGELRGGVQGDGRYSNVPNPGLNRAVQIRASPWPGEIDHLGSDYAEL